MSDRAAVHVLFTGGTISMRRDPVTARHVRLPVDATDRVRSTPENACISGGDRNWPPPGCASCLGRPVAAVQRLPDDPPGGAHALDRQVPVP